MQGPPRLRAAGPVTRALQKGISLHYPVQYLIEIRTEDYLKFTQTVFLHKCTNFNGINEKVCCGLRF